MIVVCGGIKGGSGKTTLATNLTVLRSQSGKKVLLVDADEQKSVTDWMEQRVANGFETSWITIQLSGNALNAQLLRLKPDYDDIIVDVGGRDTTSQRSAMSVANLFIVPFKPRSLDIWTMGKVKSLVSEVTASNPEMRAYAVINQADASGCDNKDALQIIEECDVLTCWPFTIGHRKAFANASSEGLAVVELNVQDRKATAEMRTLYDDIFV